VDRGDPGGVGQDEGDGMRVTEDCGLRTEASTPILAFPLQGGRNKTKVPASLAKVGIGAVVHDTGNAVLDGSKMGRLFGVLFKDELNHAVLDRAEV
jgi:hypothetical protein